MISGRLRWVCVYLITLSLIFTSGCRGNKSPQEVAQYFWNAMKVQDVESCRKYATAKTRALIDPSGERFKNAVVTFGKIVIDGDLATIDTTARLSGHGAETSLPFQTILKKEDGEWRVDYVQTKETIREDNSFSEITKNLRDLGGKLSERVNEALGEMKQKMPEYEEKIKKLGDVASKKMDEALERCAAEIKKGIEKLDGIMDEILKKEGEQDKQEEPAGDVKP
ncbi:MAG: hypothetical protein B6D35_09090 [Candidatus Brocadia sp. UTAMX2]|jgi:hypothetical protein|nr:MAG: hypothetical protein B6D35_09090 [Candidatus Brocadia sp. UTAMX2]